MGDLALLMDNTGQILIFKGAKKLSALPGQIHLRRLET
jgi:hypothetical protein